MPTGPVDITIHSVPVTAAGLAAAAFMRAYRKRAEQDRLYQRTPHGDPVLRCWASWEDAEQAIARSIAYDVAIGGRPAWDDELEAFRVVHARCNAAGARYSRRYQARKAAEHAAADTTSSASRQHHIDTGDYLRAGESL
jgi:hypothetical protein